MEAFVYCWTDKATNKLYVGSHKGSTDDGYVCSSKYMIKEYNKRPTDFSRQVIAHGTFKDMRNFESIILKSVDAALDENFYNKHNGDGNFILLSHSEETKEKMKLAKIGKKRSVDSVKKQKISITGNKNHFFGKTHSDEFKNKQSQKQKIAQLGGLNNNSISVKYENNIYSTLKDMSKYTGLSYYKIKQLMSKNKVEII